MGWVMTFTLRTRLRAGIGLASTLMAVAGGCRHPAPQPEEQLAPNRGEIVRGHALFAHEVRAFRPCGSKVDLWVIDKTEGDLWSVYKALAGSHGQRLYMEVRGAMGPPPDTGFGADYPAKLEVFQLRRAAVETQGCAEDRGGYEFKARGNEPFWGATVARDGIVFRQAGEPEDVRFPFSPPRIAGPRHTYSTAAANHRIEIAIDERRCVDSMSGEHLPLPRRSHSMAGS